MSPTLVVPAAKLAMKAVGSVIGGLSKALDTKSTDPKVAKAKAQADDFETMFLEQFTQQVMATPAGSEGPLGENGLGGDVYKSHLTKEYAKQLQKAGGIGLSDTIMRDLLRVQEQSGAAQAASGPVAAGQIRPRPRPLAAIAAGSTPATAVIEPSRASSPSTQ